MPDLWPNAYGNDGDANMKRAKQKKTESLSERIEKLRAECEAALDELSERERPSCIPGCSIRMMWLAKGGGSVFEAALLASKGK